MQAASPHNKHAITLLTTRPFWAAPSECETRLCKLMPFVNHRLGASYASLAPRPLKFLDNSNLPLNFHPAAVRVAANVTPCGAVSVPA